MTHLIDHVRRAGTLCAFALLVSSLVAAAPAAGKDADPEKRNFDLPAGDAETTLREFTRQAKVQLVFDSEKVAGVKTAAVHGETTPRAALDQMFANTGLVVQQDKASGAFTIRKETPAEAKNAASRPGSDRTAGERTEGPLKLETFEVMGKKSLNMDLPRSRDAVQPYVIFDRRDLEQSGSVDLNQFLRQRLPMNTVATSPAENAAQGNRSQINLRGLGENQTLILVDGHRMAGYSFQSTVGQSDINGIPLSAIERVEVLPTTAGGIYGGSAVGGVVNIILRRDYHGTELKLTYDNTFDTDTLIRRVDLSTGFTLEGGKTRVLLAAAWSDSHAFLFGDRPFVTAGRQRMLANNPNVFAPPNPPLLGSTPNIRSTTTNLTLRNGTPLNSLITFVPVGYAGADTDGGAALVANAGRYNLALADTAQTNGRRFAIETNPRVESLTATVRREFGSKVEAFIEAAGTNNTGTFNTNPMTAFATFSLPAGAPSNPFLQPIQVSVPFPTTDQRYVSHNNVRRLVGGLLFQLPASWQGEADYTWSRYRADLSSLPSGSINAAGSAAVANGTINIVRDIMLAPPDLSGLLNPGGVVGPFDITLRDTTLRLAGPAFGLPAGPVKFSILAERRDETFAEANAVQINGFTQLYPERSQSITSGYAETIVPLVAPKQRIPGLHSLELQASLRWDDYTVRGATGLLSVATGTPLPLSTIGRTTNRDDSASYTLGLKWQPVDRVVFRGSYGTGFLPPSVNQLQPTTTATATIIDPRRGGTTTILSGAAGQLLEGGNPALRPENSETWSAGIVLTPAFTPGLRLSLDYTRIDYRDRITAFPGGRQALVDSGEALFPDRFIRGPKLATDPDSWAGPIVFLNNSLFNIASVQLEAWDGQVDWKLPTASFGTFELRATGTFQPHYLSQALVGQPLIENAGYTFRNPLRWRASGGVTWTRRQLTVGWAATYYDSYKVYALTSTPAAIATAVLTQGDSAVPDQTYHDVFLTWKFGSMGSTRRLRDWARDLELTVGVRNIFNTAPPFDSTANNLVSPFADPRLSSYYLTIRKSF